MIAEICSTDNLGVFIVIPFRSVVLSVLVLYRVNRSAYIALRKFFQFFLRGLFSVVDSVGLLYYTMFRLFVHRESTKIKRFA